MLSQFFASNPWVGEAELLYRDFLEGAVGHPSVWNSATAIATFSFKNHDWPSFAGNRFTFGSLFTLLSAALLFSEARGRVWLLVASGSCAVAFWYALNPEQRYLMAALPLLAATTAVMFALLWRHGRIARAGLVVLVALQLAWASDMYVFPSHQYWMQPLIKLGSSGFRNQAEGRRHWLGTFQTLATAMPAGSKVVVHESHLKYGLGAMTVSDMKPWQFGLDYGLLDDAQGIFDELQRLEVTHLIYHRGLRRSSDSLAGDLVFWDFVGRHANVILESGGWTLARMPSRRPKRQSKTNVAVWLCQGSYDTGVYPLPSLAVHTLAGRPAPDFPKPIRPLPARPSADGAALEDVGFLVHSPRCGSALPAALNERLTLLYARHDASLYRVQRKVTQERPRQSEDNQRQ